MQEDYSLMAAAIFHLSRRAPLDTMSEDEEKVIRLMIASEPWQFATVRARPDIIDTDYDMTVSISRTHMT